MSDDAGGAFTIDFIAGYGIFIVLLTIVLYFAISTVSSGFTRSYATELRPMAEAMGDMLILSPGSPQGWHMSPSLARGAAFIGLSDSRPCILSEEKVYALGFFNDSELFRHLGLDDSEHYYGIRIEVSANDGSVTVASGYIVDDGTMDVCKCTRLVAIRDADGNEKGGKLVIYMWRKYVGTSGTDR
ncbi:MAG: hypothetical protein WBZ29_03765 [Methanocella sp.]